MKLQRRSAFFASGLRKSVRPMVRRVTRTLVPGMTGLARERFAGGWDLDRLARRRDALARVRCLVASTASSGRPLQGGLAGGA